jgi:hypothetical protein
LKEYHDGANAFPNRPTQITRPDPIAVEDNGAPEWEVERVLDHRVVRKRDQWLVSWKGYPLEEATWEPIENLDGALESVVAYNTKRKVVQVVNNVSVSVMATVTSRQASYAAAVVAMSHPQSELGGGNYSRSLED